MFLLQSDRLRDRNILESIIQGAHISFHLFPFTVQHSVAHVAGSSHWL